MCRFGVPMGPKGNGKVREFKVSVLSSPVTGAMEDLGIFTYRQIIETFGFEYDEVSTEYKNSIGEKFKVVEV